MKRWLPLVILLVCSTATLGVEAPHSSEMLTPEEQQLLLAQTAHRWDQMSPEEREQARERLERWKKMSPEEREQVRKRVERFRDLPPQEQERLRGAHRWYSDLPPERREELRQRWRQMTPEERTRFRDTPEQPSGRQEKRAEPQRKRPVR